MVLVTWGCENVSCQTLGVWGLYAEWEGARYPSLRMRTKCLPSARTLGESPSPRPSHLPNQGLPGPP